MGRRPTRQARPSIHPFQLLASIATILTFMGIVGRLLFSYLSADAGAAVTAKVDWFALPSSSLNLRYDDQRQLSQAIDQVNDILKIQNLPAAIEKISGGIALTLLKVTIANDGQRTSKTIQGHIDGLLLGALSFRKGSIESKTVISSENVDFGSFEPGDSATLYALTNQTYWAEPQPRLLHGDTIIPVRLERFSDRMLMDPLGIIPWAIGHSNATSFIFIMLELLLLVFFIAALPYALVFLWRAFQRHMQA